MPHFPPGNRLRAYREVRAISECRVIEADQRAEVADLELQGVNAEGDLNQFTPKLRLLVRPRNQPRNAGPGRWAGSAIGSLFPATKYPFARICDAKRPRVMRASARLTCRTGYLFVAPGDGCGLREQRGSAQRAGSPDEVEGRVHHQLADERGEHTADHGSGDPAFVCFRSGVKHDRRAATDGSRFLIYHTS